MTVTNQFGTQSLNVGKADRLLVPTAKSLTGRRSRSPAPLDHFKCYRVSGARGPAHSQRRTDSSAAHVDIKKPLHLCAPANKNGEGIFDPTAHLLCYRARMLAPAFADLRLRR